MKELLLVTSTSFIHFLLMTFVDLIEPWILNPLDAYNRRVLHCFIELFVNFVKFRGMFDSVNVHEVNLYLLSGFNDEWLINPAFWYRES